MAAPRSATTLPGTPAPGTAPPVVRVEGASKRFCRAAGSTPLRLALADAARELLGRAPAPGLRDGEFWALEQVSFALYRGESVGVMGANGAGKSTLLRLILGTLRLTAGRITTRGRIAAITEQGVGFDPDLSGRDNVFLGAAVLGVPRRRAQAAFDDIVAFAELERFIDTPLRCYSSGMRARLGFAVAMQLQPDLLLVDEVLAVGDVGFQRRCIAQTRRYLEAGGSLLLVSHNPMLVHAMCGRCLVLDRGALVFDGDVVSGVSEYCGRVRHDGVYDETGPAGDRAAVFDPAALGSRDEAFPAQAAAAPASAGTRSSPAAVDIEAFGIYPQAGDALVTGQPAKVFLRYRAHRAVTARWGFCLLTGDLATPIACEGPWTPVALAPGAGELSGTLPALPLAGGRFALRVALMDPDTELPYAMRGYRDAPQRFNVTMPVSARNNLRAVGRDLIVLEGVRWAHAAPVATGPTPDGSAPRAAPHVPSPSVR